MERSISRHLRGLVLLGFLVIFLAPKEARGIAESTPFKFEGCPVQSMTQAGPKGEYVYAACPGPLGIFVSGDFGENWEFAGGGDYKEGPARVVLGTKKQIFAIAAKRVYWAVPAIKPEWHELELTRYEPDEIPLSLAANDMTLFVGTSAERVHELRIDPQTFSPLSPAVVSYIETESISLGGGIRSIAVSASDAFLLLHGKVATFVFKKKLTYIGGILRPSDWKRLEIDAPEGRLPDDASIYGVHSDGKDTIYLLAPFPGIDKPDGIAPFLIGTNKSALWTRPEVPFNGPQEVKSASLVRMEDGNFDVHLLGEYISRDGGRSFDIRDRLGFTPNSQIFTMLPFNGKAVLLDRNNTQRSLSSSYAGPLLYLGPENNVQTLPRFNGITGALATKVIQSPQNPDLAIIGYLAGVSVTRNFTAVPTSIEFEAPEPPYLNGKPLLRPITEVAWDKFASEPTAIIVAGALFEFKPEQTLIDERWRIQPASNIGLFNLSSYVAVTENHLYLGTLTEYGKLSGRVLVFERVHWGWEYSKDKALGEIPVSALLAVSDSTVFVGSAGLATGADDFYGAKRGVLVTNDSGRTWRNIVDSTNLFSSIPSLAYDDAKDTLYAAANLEPLLVPEGYSDTFSGNDHVSKDALPSDSRKGTVLRIEKASSTSPVIKSAEKGLPDDLPISFVTFDSVSRMIYATAGQKVYISPDGKVWSLLYEGLETEETRGVYVLQNDDSEPQMSAASSVVVASTAGTQAIIGYPVLNVWGMPEQVRRKDAINLRFSTPLFDDRDNLGKVSIWWKKQQLATELAKKDALTNSYSLMPKKGSWPKAKRSELTVKIGDGILDIDKRKLDSDFNGFEDGLEYIQNIGLLSSKKQSKPKGETPKRR